MMAAAISRAIQEHIDELVHTCLPGRVQKYDHSKRMADVKPLIKRQYADGTLLDMPVIANVPVIFMKTEDFELYFPIKNGDLVLLLFCERSIDKWLSSSGTETVPDDARKFSISDAVAIPGLYPFSKATKAANDGSVSVTYKGASLVFTSAGEVRINGDFLTVKAP